MSDSKPDDLDMKILLGLITALLRYAVHFNENELTARALTLMRNVVKVHEIDPDSLMMTLPDDG